MWPIFVRSHLLWEAAELNSIDGFLQAIGPCFPGRLRPLTVLDLPLGDIYGKHWSITGCETPDADSPDEAVYLPGRNALLLVKVAVWCQLHAIRQLALGVLGSNPFADATPAFFDQFQTALGTALGTQFQILRPFAHRSKSEVMRLGAGLPLELTFSCIAPQNDLHCGRCNKCAERRAAFASVGAEDSTQYAAEMPASP